MSTRSRHTVFLHPRVSSDSANDRTLVYMEWYSKAQRIHQTLFLCCLKVIKIVSVLVYMKIEIKKNYLERQTNRQASRQSLFRAEAVSRLGAFLLPFGEMLIHRMVTLPLPLHYFHRCSVAHKGVRVIGSQIF